jgi:hypothetical protein
MFVCGFMRASLGRLAGEGRTKINSHTRGLLLPAPNDRFAPRPGPYTYVGIGFQCLSGLARRLPLNTIFMRFGGPKGHSYTLRLYEREGLLKPSRSDGNTRLYTDLDLERLEVILKCRSKVRSSY